MDEFNNDRNPFEEEKQGTQNPYGEQQGYQQQAPYQQPQNPYNQQPDPYNQQPNQYSQQQNPYSQQPNQYNQQQNPYSQPYQQNIPQQGYAQPRGYGMPYQPYASRQQSTGMAVASLVLGIISIVCAFFSLFIVPLIIPLIGLILGIVYKTKHYTVGRGISTAGIITSAIGLVLPFVLLVVLVAAMPALIEFVRQNSPEQYKELYDTYSKQFPEWFNEAAIFIKSLF